MGKIIVAGIVVLVLLSGAYLYRPVYIESAPADAQELREITVEVTFRDPVAESPAVGDACGYESIFDGKQSPHSRQVIVKNAAGVIVGTVDLLDVFDLAVTDQAKPGTINEDGYCVVVGSVTAPPSTHYTFEVEGVYLWTVSATDLQQMNWTMPVLFLETSDD